MKKFILLSALAATVQLFAASDQEIARYKVIKHDNIFRISLVYNSTIEDIMRANPGIDPQHLRPGSILDVPANTKIRDEAFVLSILNGHMPEPVAEKPVTVVRETVSRSVAAMKEPVREAPRPVVKEVEKAQPTAIVAPKTERPAPKMEEEKPFAVPMTEDENPFVAPAAKKAEPATIAPAAKTEAPAVTPAEKKAEVPTIVPVEKKIEIVTAPAKTETAAAPAPKKQVEVRNADEDENPFSTAVSKKVEVAPAPAEDENPFVVPAKKEAPAATKASNSTSAVENANPNATVVDVTKIKVDPTANTYKDSAKELNSAIDTKMVTVLNLQIVMKDGSVKTYTNRDDQKRVLSQLASGAPLE